VAEKLSAARPNRCAKPTAGGRFAGAGLSSSNGSSNQNVDPAPSDEITSMVPPIWRTSSLAM
jgi:hypothetical protein